MAMGIKIFLDKFYGIDYISNIKRNKGCDEEEYVSPLKRESGCP